MHQVEKALSDDQTPRVRITTNPCDTHSGVIFLLGNMGRRDVSQ